MSSFYSLYRNYSLYSLYRTNQAVKKVYLRQHYHNKIGSAQCMIYWLKSRISGSKLLFVLLDRKFSNNEWKRWNVLWTVDVGQLSKSKGGEMKEEEGRRRRGRQWGTRRYQWPRLCTLHFPLRKGVCWAKRTHSAASGLGEDSAEEQPGHRLLSSRSNRHITGNIPANKEATCTKI